MLSFNLSNGLFTIFLKNIKLKLAKYRCAIIFHVFGQTRIKNNFSKLMTITETCDWEQQ